MIEVGIRIGEVAARAGVSPDAIRYYEKHKLLPRATRTEGGFRLFPEGTVERIRFIKGAQSLGFSLDEVGRLLAGKAEGVEECQKMYSLLCSRLQELEDRMKSMAEFRDLLVGHIRTCESVLDGREDRGCCPVITEISRPIQAANCCTTEASRIAREGRALRGAA
jgi:MerR family transcriptional regulator, copper efflux regulator